MNPYYITVQKGTSPPLILPQRVEFNPTVWSAIAVGGNQAATVNMSGPASGVWQTMQWLGYKISIHNHIGDEVWWGHISKVTVGDGNFSAGIDLDSMSNRIRVAYTYSLPDGSTVRGDTAWVQDDASVDRFGIKELQHSAGTNKDDTAAASLRDSLLGELRYPLPTHGSIGAGDGITNGTIECSGDFTLAEWQYYTELRGLEESNTSGNASVPVGYAFTQVASWLSDEDKRELWVQNQVLDGLEKDMVIDVTGTNAGTYTISGSARGEIESTTETIDFLGDQDISGAVGIVGTWSNGDVISVTGSTNNDGWRIITKIEDEAEIRVKPKTISTSAGNTNVTITRGYSVKLEELPTSEAFGVTSTVTPRGYQLAQSFQLSNNVDPWTCDTISIRILKVGTPTDDLKVELRSGGASAPSATVLASDTIAASEIYDTSAGWYEFDMGNTIELTYGTNYWIVVSRTGSNNGQSYYSVSIDEDVPYTLGSLKLATIGGAWVARPTDATMPFIVRGRELITEQMTNIVTNHAQFVEELEIIDASTVSVNQYREGDTTALFELSEFLEMGVNDGRRYICHMTPERRLVVREEPSKPDLPQLTLAANGAIEQTRGGLFPAGRMVAGEWLDMRTTNAMGDALSSMVPYFCERSEFDAESGQWRAEPKRSNPYDLGIRQG